MMDIILPKMYSGLSPCEKEIAAYIQCNDTGDFQEILKRDGRWEVFYHLSPMRLSILNWYGFRPDASLLEIGGAFGALTGLFCDKCRTVVSVEKSYEKAEAIRHRHRNRANLEVCVRDLKKLGLQEKYDYIVLVDVLETMFDGAKEQRLYAGYIAYIRQFLKEDGILLLTVSNRLGLKYFCGAKEEYTGKAFAGINRYPKGSSGYAFSKKEIMDILKSAGMEDMRFYYPLPDHRLPQVVYSQEYLPAGRICDRVIPYYVDASQLVAMESDLYEDIIQNGMFEFFANSFLIECAKKEDRCDVVYAVLSTDRGREHGFATCMHSNGTVSKTALFDEGARYLKAAYDNILAIEKRGIHVVQHRLEQNKILMPRIKSRNFMEHLYVTLKQDKEQFLWLMDKLYGCVLASSVHVDAGKNELRVGSKTVDELDIGVVLACAYIDMVPMNCFWIEGELYFFDQEFMKKNYPAKYVMFRSVLYFYIFYPEADKLVSEERLKERYALAELWELFLQEEERFVSSNRNWELYANFYGWTNIDREAVYARC